MGGRGRVRLAFVVPPERYASTLHAVRIKDAPVWTTRLEQVVMTLPDDAFDAAVGSACAEAADAAEAVDTAAMMGAASDAEEHTSGSSRKRRATSALLPAGGGSP